MRNLKKLLAVIVAICVLATMTVPAFAESDKTAAEIAETLGILKGDSSEGVTDAYLAKGTNRMQAAILYLRLLGLEEEAYAETSEETFADADEVVWAEGKALLAYLKNRPELGWIGDGTNFNPNGEATAQMLYKVILTALGYVEGEDFEYADTIEFAGEKGLDAIASVTELSNEDVAEALVEALSVEVKDGSKTLLEKLIEDGVISEEDAEEAGLIGAAVALDVSSAVALNSKIVEVKLGTAAAQKDLTGITVADADGKDVAVSKIEFAPWATDGKSILVTLAADTTAGTYYTLTAGEKSVNFGGRPVDETKPEISGDIIVEDYNEIRINFTEPILLTGTVEITETYGDKELETSTIAYVDSDTIKVATAEQADSTLYSVKVKGFKDLMNLAMEDSTDKTFVGTAKPTDKNTIADAKAVDSKTIEVQFTLKIDDTTTLDASKYTVAECYDAKTSIEVASVEAKADTEDTVLVKLAADTKGDTLYEIKIAAGITTLYGVATTDALTATFVGEPKDETAIESIFAAAVSNTKVQITAGSSDVKDAFDADTAKEMFTIKEAYGSKELTISAIEIDKNVAKLTVSAQEGVLYEVKMLKGVKDAAGNATTADLTTTFVGEEVAAKISAIESITRESDTVIIVNFDKNVGDTATDVSHYTIDGGVGYPHKAETTDNPDEVKLTIPKTEAGKLYTLTVKGLENADGVAMDADGVTGKFSGAGLDSTEPKVEGVVALDAQTLRIFFDRSVTDASIKGAGKIWDANAVISGALTYADKDNAAVDLDGAYAYQDFNNENALIVRVTDTDAFKSSNFPAGATKFALTVDANVVSNTAALPFANKDTAPTNPEIKGVVANNKYTLTVIFSEPVSDVDANGSDFVINTAKDGSGTPITVDKAVKIDERTYQLRTSTPMTAGTSYFLRVVDGIDPASDDNKTINKIKDITGIVELKATNDSTSERDYAAYQLAGSGKDAGDITSIQVTMTDARTMVIYYPEAMNTADSGDKSVVVAANYTIQNGASTPVELIDNDTEIAEIKWDADKNTATLIFKADIDDSTSGYYVKFAQTIENALGTKFVKNDDKDVVKQFARKTNEAAKVAIDSVSYDRTTKEITIKLNMKAMTDDDIATTTPFANTLAYIGITTRLAGNAADDIGGDTNEIASVAIKDGDTDVTDTTHNDFDTIIITLTDEQAAEMVNGLVGTVTIKSADFTGINGMAGNTSSKAEFIQ